MPKEKITTWDEDQDDEVATKTKVVRAPNGKKYRIRAISALDRQLIHDASTSGMEFRGERTGEIRLNSVLLRVHTLRKGIAEPDFSKRSVEEIKDWMKKKMEGVVLFLTNEIMKLSGATTEALEQADF